MSSAADLRRTALTLPEAYEDFHRRRPAFRVRQRIFAMLGVAGNAGLFASLDREEMAVVKLDREDQLNLAGADPETLWPTEAYGHHGWTYVRLGAIDEAMLTTVVRLAWTHVAPKRLRALGRPAGGS
jgi:hypothetical protein